jgi:hypothetical protein
MVSIHPPLTFNRSARAVRTARDQGRHNSATATCARRKAMRAGEHTPRSARGAATHQALFCATRCPSAEQPANRRGGPCALRLWPMCSDVFFFNRQGARTPRLSWCWLRSATFTNHACGGQGRVPAPITQRRYNCSGRLAISWRPHASAKLSLWRQVTQYASLLQRVIRMEFGKSIV